VFPHLRKAYFLLIFSLFSVLPTQGFTAKLDGSLVYSFLRPYKIYANSPFLLSYSIKNTGKLTFKTYGLSLEIYDSQKRKIDFPSGETLGYPCFAPLPAGSIKSGSVSLLLPSLSYFSFPSGRYYYLIRLYASDKVLTQRALFSSKPVDSESLQKFEIYNPSIKETDVSLEEIFIKEEPLTVGTTNTIILKVKNNALVNQFNITVDFCIDGELVERKQIKNFGSGEETNIEYFWIPPETGDYLIKGRVLGIADGNPKNNIREKLIEVKGNH